MQDVGTIVLSLLGVECVGIFLILVLGVGLNLMVRAGGLIDSYLDKKENKFRAKHDIGHYIYCTGDDYL